MSPLLQFALGLSALLVAGAYVWSMVAPAKSLSHLRPALDRLEDAARQSRVTAAEAKRGKELAVAIARVDHAQLLRLLEALSVKVMHGNDASARMEVAAAGVAADLAATHARADAVPAHEPHGASADAAMRLRR